MKIRVTYDLDLDEDKILEAYEDPEFIRILRGETMTRLPSYPEYEADILKYVSIDAVRGSRNHGTDIASSIVITVERIP